MDEQQTTVQEQIKKEPISRSIWFSRFNMSTPVTTGDGVKNGEESTLRFGIYRDNPRIEVFTNEPSDKQNNYGKILAAMDPVTWQMLANYVEELCLSDQPGKQVKVIENYNLYKSGQRFDEPQLINRTVLTRTEEGLINIKLVEEGRPSPVFVFGPPRFHALLRSDKSQVPAAQASQLYAKATFKILSEIMASFIAQSHHKETNDNKLVQTKQGGQNGWQNKQNYQSNQSGGSGGWSNRSGGNNRGNWNSNRQGSGNWQNRQGSGQGSYNRQGGYNKGNWQGKQMNPNYQQQKAVNEIADDDLPF